MDEYTELRISVVCCTRNRESFVRTHCEAIAKILPKEAELVYALDHCTDGTLAYLQAVASRNGQVRIIDNTSNPGLFNCRNFALDHVRGRFVHFLDDDDAVSEDFYRRLSDFIADPAAPDFILTDLAVNTEGQASYRQQIIDRSVVPTTRRGAGEYVCGDLFEAVLKGRLYFNSANALISKKLFDRYRFRPDIKKTADWLLYLEIALREKINAVYLSDVHAIYNVQAGSMSIAGDKSYWNMRSFEVLYGLMERDHPSFSEVERVYGKALFDAGYAERSKSARAAFAYYRRSMRYGPWLPAIKAMVKLLVPPGWATQWKKAHSN